MIFLDPLKKYAVFSGRARRKEFWLFQLMIFIVSLVLSFIDALTFGADLEIFSTIFSLAIIIPNLAVSVRRLHDIDRSGWWLWAVIIPALVGTLFFFLFLDYIFESFWLIWVIMAPVTLAYIWFIVICCLRGTEGDNRFGADPIL